MKIQLKQCVLAARLACLLAAPAVRAANVNNAICTPIHTHQCVSTAGQAANFFCTDSSPSLQ